MVATGERGIAVHDRGNLQIWDGDPGKPPKVTTGVHWGPMSIGARRIVSGVWNQLPIMDSSRNIPETVLVGLRDNRFLFVSPRGHYYESPGVEEEIVYVVQRDDSQHNLTPAEFAREFGWTNDPDSVKLRP
jgi:hypothetical protein